MQGWRSCSLRWGDAFRRAAAAGPDLFNYQLTLPKRQFQMTPGGSAMPLARFFRRWKTPEIVQNNGGWRAFIIFTGVPAVLAIGGVVDPIFDFFLTFFSVDEAGHIGTHWTVKYGLFIVFFFLIPSSIYLLIIRLNPSLVKSKVAEAYNDITKEVSRIYAQMYGASQTSRHNLGKLHFVFRIDAKYSLECEGKIVLIAKQDLHFWKYAVEAEAEGDSQDFIADIGFAAKAAGRRTCAFLPLKDTPHRKEVAIAFLPYVKKGDQCEVTVNWAWPRCMGPLRDNGAEEYGWTCDGVDKNSEGEIHWEFQFDKKLGDIQCRNVGINPKGAVLKEVSKPNEIVWTFIVPKAPLGKGRQYRLMFERR